MRIAPLLALTICLALLGAQTALAADFAATLEAFDAAFAETSQAFTQPTVIEQVDENGELVDFRWQAGRYREEYRWLGFTEVFAYDGAQHWYGSDINLPYALDGGAPASISLELCRTFSFLQEPWRSHLRDGSPTLAAINRFLNEEEESEVESRQSDSAVGQIVPAPKAVEARLPIIRGEVLSLTPPGMAEALLALHNGELHVYLGDKRLLADSHVLVETHFSGMQPMTACTYASKVHTLTYDNGKLVNTRTSSVRDVRSAEEVDERQFTTAGSPEVPAPPLPRVPYTVSIELDDTAVLVPCTAPDGTRLKLALDTGANIGLLRREVVERLGLAPQGKEQISGHGARASVGYVRAENFRIGDAVIPAWPAAVMQDTGGLDRRLGLTGVDGLLGNFLLHAYVVQIDYPRSRMTLWPREQFDANQLGSAFTAKLHRERLPYSDVIVDGRIEGGAYFNTGGKYPFSLAYWACDDAEIVYPLESMGRGISVGGSSMFGMIRPGEVRLIGVGAGPAPALGEMATRAAAGAAPTLTIKSPLTMLELLAPGEPKSRWRIGSFGSGFLQNYAVTFDLLRGRVYLQQP